MSEDIRKYLVRFSQDKYNERNTAQFEGIRTEAAQTSRVEKYAMKNLLEEWKDQERLKARERKQRQRVWEQENDIENGLQTADGTLVQKKVSNQFKTLTFLAHLEITEETIEKRFVKRQIKSYRQSNIRCKGG